METHADRATCSPGRRHADLRSEAEVVSCGLVLHVREEGCGLPLVMLHGFGQDLSTFDAVVPLLSSRHRCIRVDLVGHGRSEKPSDIGAYMFDAICRQLHDLLGLLDARDCVLLGYSMGGRIALTYAERFGEELRGLVLESAGLGPATEGERAEARTRDAALAERIRGSASVEGFFSWWDTLPLFATQRRLPAEVRRHMEEVRARNTLEALALSVEGHGAHAMEDGRPYLRTRAVPGLYIAGSEDGRYAHLAAGLQHEGIMEVCLLPAGHDVHLEEPSRYGDVLGGFLDALPEKEDGDGDRSLARG